MTRQFTVWVDGTPVLPESPLDVEQAITEFREMLAEDADQVVEIREYEEWS